MQVAQLETIVQVAKTGHLGRAAEALYVTQPALTSRLQSVEAELGAILFVRSRHGMRLTDAGRAFLPHAQRALGAIDDGRRLVAEVQRGGAGEVAIGAAPAVSTYVLPALLKQFASEHPKVRLTVRTGHSEEILEMLLRDSVQVGLVREMRHQDIESVPVYEDRLLLVATHDHPMAGRSSVRLEELADQQLIYFDRTSSYHELTHAMFRAAGVEPAGVMELDNIDATKKMVQQGLGLAFLPHTAVSTEVADGSLVSIAIADAAPVRRQIVAITRRDAGPSSILVDFMSALRNVEVPA